MFLRRIPILLASVFLWSACSDSKTYQVGIVKPLMVLNVTPGGADNVPLDSELTVQFSDPVAEGSLTPDTVMLAGPEEAPVPLEAAFTYDGAENKLTLKPAKPFAYSAVYTLTITKKVKRLADKAVVAKEIVHTFRTIDPPVLSIIESAPSGNSTSIGTYVNIENDMTPYGERVSTTVVVHFSEGIDKKSVTAASFTLKDSDGVVVPGVFTWESTDEKAKDLLDIPIATDDILTFTPDAPLKLSTVYTITLKGTFKGIISKRATSSAGWFAENVVWTFRTIDPPPLGLVSSVPSRNAVNVGPIVYYSGGVYTVGGDASVYGNAVSHNVTLSFTESVDVDSFAANVTLVTTDEFGVPSTTGVAGTWTYSSSDTMSTEPWTVSDTWTFVPTEPWSLSGNYAVVIKDTLESYRATAVAGTIEKDIELAWETAHPATLQLVSNTPTDGGVNVGKIIYVGASTIDTPESNQFGNVASHTVVLQFSESADTTLFADVKVFTAGEDGVPTATEVTGSWVSSNSTGTDPWKATDTWTFTPTANWALSGNYAVVIPATVASYRATPEGGTVAQAFTIDWEEVHPLPLRVVSVSPSDGGLDVGAVAGAGYGASATYMVVVKFSEAINAAQLSTITLTDLETSTVTSPLVLSDSSTEPWRQNDIATYVLTSALSKNWQVNIPATLTTYRGTAESGALGGSGVTFDWDMADPLPLVLENTFPGNGAEVSESFVNDVNSGTDNGDEVGVAFTMWFSEPVDRVSLEAAFTFEENGSDITNLGTFTYAGGDTAVTFTPPALQLSSTYEVSLIGGSIGTPFGGVESFRGNAVEAWYDTADDTGGYLDGNQTIWFTTPDPEALTIVSITPSVDTGSPADNIARNSSIVVTFSEPVAASIMTAIATGPTNAYVRLTTDASTVVPATYSFNGAGTVLTINPTADLKFSTEHRLSVLGGSTGIVSWRVTSVSGWLVPTGTTVHKFKTIDPATLLIWATSPSDQEDAFGVSVTDVAVESDLQILFDQAIDHASFESSITIRRCGADTTNCATGSTITPATISYTTFGGGAEKAIIALPPGALTFDTFFEITIAGGSTGVRSLLNTGLCATACEGGYMPADYTITFGTRSIPPLKVKAKSPVDGESGVSIRPKIIVEFASVVSLPTLTQYTYFVTDVTNNQLVERFDGASLYATNNTAEIVLTSDLDFDTEYNIVLVSSIQGTDGRFLGRDVRFSFHTKQASLVLDTDPSNSETAVELNLSQRDFAGNISVYFDGAVTSAIDVNQAMSVTYVTARGTVLLRGYVTAVTTTGTIWKFNPSDFCTPGEDPLVANATYYISITDDVWRADGSAQLTGGIQTSFSTAGHTLIAGASASNAVTGRPDLTIDLDADTDSLSGNGKDDVPVTSRFTISFAELMDTSTIVYSATANSASDTLLVKRSDNTYANLKNVTLTSSSVSFDADDTAYNLVTNDLAFLTGYTIILKESVRDLLGNTLADDYEITFTTSAAPTATLVPGTDDVSKHRNATLGVVFSTAIAPESLTDANFFVGESVSGCPTGPYVAMPALIDLGYDAHSAAVILSPMMAASVCHSLELAAGSAGPRDSRGNPFPGPSNNGTSYTRRVASTANDNGTTTIATTVLNPLSGAVNVTGRQSIRVTVATSNTNGDVLVTSINPGTFMVYSNAGRTVEVPGRVYFDPSVSAVVFDIASTSYFTAGSIYYVKLSTALSSTTRNNCTNCANYQFTVESVAPTVTVGPYVGAQSSVGPISVTFNEGMRSATIINAVANLGVFDSTTTFDSTTLVAGTWTLNTTNTVASFVPTLPLNAGATYTVRVNTGAKDYAGTSVAGVTSAAYVVEAVAPTVLSVGNFTVVDQTIDVTFSENVALASVLTSLLGETEVIPGSLRIVTDLSGVDPLNALDVANTSAEVYSCAVVNGAVVTLDPIDLLGSGLVYKLGVNTGVTDLGGTALATGASYTRVTP